MKNLLLFLSILASSLTSTVGQSFNVAELSKLYDVKIHTSGLRAGIWTGETTIEVFRKRSKRPLQTMRLPHTYINADGIKLATVGDKKKGVWSNVYLADLNFDGHEDLAVADGLDGGYSAISYTIYRYVPRSGRFVRDARLTRLAHGPYMGIPEPDYGRRTLSVFSKSGCCMHYQEMYRVSGTRVSKIEEVNDYYDSPSDPGYEVIETKKLTRGRWRTFVKKKRITEN